jgi:hypothetical protein
MKITTDSSPHNQKILDAKFTITLFTTVAARFKTEQQVSFNELIDLFGQTTATSKDQLPLIKLARFGALTSRKGCLRHDGNMLCITGIECDYDGGEIAFEEAARRMQASHLHCLIYTSPSHTEDHPRWRILCPFGGERPVGEHGRMVARINGIFDGKLARESFTQSQAYYFGRVGPALIGVV